MSSWFHKANLWIKSCFPRKRLSHPITVNFVLGSENYQGQQGRSLTTTVKEGSRTRQWAQGQPSVSTSSMGWQPPLNTEHTLQPRERKHCSALIRNISPEPKMRGGLVYSDSEISTAYSSFTCSHSLLLLFSPFGENPVGLGDPAREQS